MALPIAGESERFGEKYVHVVHAGIDFEVVEDPVISARRGSPNTCPSSTQFLRLSPIGRVTVRELEDMDTFMRSAWVFPSDKERRRLHPL